MEKVRMRDAPARLPELTKRCCYGGESFLLTNSGKAVAVLSPVGGPEQRGTQHDTAGATAEETGLHAVANGRSIENQPKRNFKNRTRRASAKGGAEALGASLPTDLS